VLSSYGGAALTQNNPRDRKDDCESKWEKAARENVHRMIRRSGLNTVGSTGVTHQMIRQNQTPTPVQLSREASKCS